ncbi:AraC family transcriptional regulator [Colwellia sp.]|uniref:helix-turn-helix domain-containing protein n=1 Tax=Colwellia sp. TaxID=56799 RepID=UPI0025B84425|nr:AraC family transcriptional regulator [Colwellia sp.]
MGALYSLNSVPFSQALLNTVKAMNFEGFKGAAFISADELLVKAKDEPDNCIELLDELFLPLLAYYHEDTHSEITRKIIPLLSNNKPINELADLLFCSQRSVERSFLKVTGFTLKQCQSMNKLVAILEYLYQRKESDIDWVDIACQFVFSDQPHLIRYLKQQIQLTPKNYSQQRGFTIDVYGGVASK